MKVFICFILLSINIFGNSFKSDDALFKFIYQKDHLELEQQQYRLRYLSAAAIGGSFFMKASDNRNGYLMGGLIGLTALYVDRQESVISNAYEQYIKNKSSDPSTSAKSYLLGIQDNYRSLRQKITLGLVISTLVSIKKESYDQQISRQLITVGIAGGMWKFEFPVERMIREHYESKKISLKIVHGTESIKLGLALNI